MISAELLQEISHNKLSDPDIVRLQTVIIDSDATCITDTWNRFARYIYVKQYTYYYAYSHWNILFDIFLGNQSGLSPWENFVNRVTNGEIDCKGNSRDAYVVSEVLILMFNNAHTVAEAVNFYGLDAFVYRAKTAIKKMFDYPDKNLIELVDMHEIHSGLVFEDPLAVALSNANMLTSGLTGSFASDHIRYFLRHMPRKYINAVYHIKPINQRASQIIAELPTGKELFLVTSNHHILPLEGCPTANAWCVAFAPEAYRDKPIPMVIEQMMPTYENKCIKK